MKKIFAALAFASAIPAVAQAQSAPAPAPAPTAEKKCCCDKMGDKMKHDDAKAGHDEHSGHDMGQSKQPKS